MSREAFAALRAELESRHRETVAAAFVPAVGTIVATGVEALDRALAGGFPRGAIATIEGPPSSGRTTIAARLLAQATQAGLGAVVGTEGIYPPALAAAGVDLQRLMIVPAHEPLGAARATDILVRSAAFAVVVIPALPKMPGISAATWTRLAGLAHRANTALVAVGVEASEELRYFASLRVETAIERVRWNGQSGICAELWGYDVRATVRKHKRAAPGGTTVFPCVGFEDRPTAVALRERTLVHQEQPVARATTA